MDFRESLEFLYGLQRFGIKLGLDNTRTLLQRAGMTKPTFLCVHVAGTNGKGSTAAFLAAILQAAGYSVGLYTSPHLQSFGERIRIDGVAISEGEVAALTAQIRSLAPDLPVTFFEFTTVMALCTFAEKRVDIAILETGMGGRLDATNAVIADLSLITPVSLDHEEYLGPTLAAIAAEKAGIIKAGVTVISSLQEQKVLTVVEEEAERCQAPLLAAGRDFFVTIGPEGDFSYVDSAGTSLTGLFSGLAGAHQPENAGVAVAAALQLRRQGLTIPDAAIRQGLRTVVWPGRLEWWEGKEEILLDGAHNGAGARVLAAYLASRQDLGIHWLVGVKNDKNYREILAPLLPLTRRLYALAPPGVAAIEPEELVTIAASAGVPGKVYATVAAALQSARSACQAGEIIVVAGSLFLVGAVRAVLCESKERS